MKRFDVVFDKGAEDDLFEVSVLGFRELRHKPYRIFYSIEASTVYVHCVLDGRRDIQTLLQERLLR